MYQHNNTAWVGLRHGSIPLALWELVENMAQPIHPALVHPWIFLRVVRWEFDGPSLLAPTAWDQNG